MPQHAPSTSRIATLLQSPAIALILVMIAAALWATVGVASRLFPDDIAVTDEAYGFIRTAVAGPALLILWCLCGGRRGCGRRRGELCCFSVDG